MASLTDTKLRNAKPTEKPYKLQDGLGVMNDISVARRLLDEAGLRSVSAARQVIEGWYGCRLDVHERQFAEIWQQFLACERPWKV